MINKLSIKIKKTESAATMLLSENIRCLRKRMNLSQEELGTKIGLNRGNIASYEKGTAEPKICNLLKLAHLFGISILDLTKKDLRDENAFNSANSIYQQMAQRSKEISEQHQAKAQEYEMVINSIYNCQCFKMKNIDASNEKDIQTITANFEQLHEVTQALLQAHKDLIEVVSHKKC